MKKPFRSFLFQRDRADWPGAWKTIHLEERDVPPLSDAAQDRILSELKEWLENSGDLEAPRYSGPGAPSQPVKTRSLRSRAWTIGFSGMAAAASVFLVYALYHFTPAPPADVGHISFRGQPVPIGEVVRAKEQMVYAAGHRSIVVADGSLVRFRQGGVDLREGNLFYESPHTADDGPERAPPFLEAGGLRFIPLGTRAMLTRHLDHTTLAVVEGSFRVVPGDQIVHAKQILEAVGPAIAVRPMKPDESRRVEGALQGAASAADADRTAVFRTRGPADQSSVEMTDGRILYGTVTKEGRDYVLAKEGQRMLLPPGRIIHIREIPPIEASDDAPARRD